MDKRLMTPQEYVNAHVNEYPSLYASKNPKLRIMDQLFNVIGNGVVDFEDAITYSHKYNVNEPQKKYLDGSDLFYVYPEYEEIIVGNQVLKMPKGVSLDDIISEEEQANYPNHYFMKIRKSDGDDPFIPYPNFLEKYSVIWSDANALSSMSDEWKAAAFDFYKTMLEFFQNPKHNTNYRDWETCKSNGSGPSGAGEWRTGD